MATYTPDTLKRLTIYYIDEQEIMAHSNMHVAAAASDGDIQALVAAFQALTDLSINKYELTTTNIITGQPAAVAFGTGASFASAKAAMRLLFVAGASDPVTRATLFGPKESVVELDDIGNAVLKEDAALVIALQTAAVAVLVNSGGDEVTALKDGRLLQKHRQR